MDHNPNLILPDESLFAMLRRRRRELRLRQVDVAYACDVTPEAVTHWESGRRHMEFCKIPRLAGVLQIDPQQLCAIVLREFHPVFYYHLFGRPGTVAKACNIQY
jgi:transcriptional regulator with XRE-family HTH domain